ncbi:ankyrin repeat domain-containing protein [Nitratireductor sp. XY-223]|uniref:ankyrin repeat domain-containing protein n=1 Tax=Nitratireductor sp. XY-223 TaxID=2561926 RepID=UPI001FEE305A|nr:ankyrin repeat domain-containing protein [Nitratireductor sp. XY-223]
MSRLFSLLVFAVGVSLLATKTHAQVPPGPAEVAAYDGLLKAAHDGDIENVRELLAAGADADMRDARGRTPAHIAAFASNEAVLRELADAGADLNALDQQLFHIVTIAAVADDPEFLALALELGASAGNVTSRYDGTALIWASHLGHVEVVQILIDAGAPLDHVNNLDWTALIEAVVLGDGGPDHVRIVKALVDAGADKSIGDRQGKTPLQLAEEHGYAEIVELLR